MKKIFTFLLLLTLGCFSVKYAVSQGVIIPTDESQNDFLKTYKLILNASNSDYRTTSSDLDTLLFPAFSEFSVYWAKNGTHSGSFIMPNPVSEEYASVTANAYQEYDWQTQSHYAIQFKKHQKKVAIFRSSKMQNNSTISWQAVYFKSFFDSYLFDDIYYFVDETALSNGLHPQTELLIIPAFAAKEGDNSFFIQQIITENPAIKTQIDDFLSQGGMLYAEGNAALFIEKLEYLSSGTIDFENAIEPHDGETFPVEFTGVDNPVSFTQPVTENKIYANVLPVINLSEGEAICQTDESNPVCFVLHGEQANNGKILINTALPTVGGTVDLENGSRQLQWTFNSVLYAFAHPVDVFRYIRNEIPDGVTANKNAVSYNRSDTFEVKIIIRNLSDIAIANIEISEDFRDFFTFVDVITIDVTSDYQTDEIIFSGISVPAHAEKEIIYRLKTPEPEDTIHEYVDDYLSFGTNMYASKGNISYQTSEGKHSFTNYHNFVDIMFSAEIIADTDLNWKNFLGLDYQPFKVFMIMENKERTSALETRYTQYIPKDVPFYQSDNSINIPVLKTPGGSFIDILRGSNNEDNPQYDMDSDGNPDVWLDTASIYPKGYQIVEEEVYWLNPWEHLRSDDEPVYYEDIDHDGQHAQDTDGDGIVDIEEPGDKIRVWKVTWNIGEVPGYQFYDPYCSYEIWVDPPDLVPLSAGVAYAHDSLHSDVENMFYPYTENLKDIEDFEPVLQDTAWKYWMERDENNHVVWKQLIYQTVNNYEGFTFIDTAKQHYQLQPTDSCYGTVPQPHREFIAVLSLGGEEIDMENPTPQSSLYSKINYKTIFNEDRETPIRTTYTYYAPLPNPLQFEYLTNNCLVTDFQTGEPLTQLPNRGKANISFEIDAATEYSYYWIRNVGHDVDYNDPSEEIDGIESLGDGVFGYMIYDIPKGVGGYSITLPKYEDGSFAVDSIVEIDGKPFQKWLDNENTGDSIEIWEDQFKYQIYIPQLLIPPALDDNNYDGIDDWIDDQGDRFCSETGFLHDKFMPGNGEDYPDYPETPFEDDIYGMVDSGWYQGADNTYGDDFFENLGKTHFTINAVYEGDGREGPVELSKGGWLVVEEIFGGSPWVIFSHTLSGYAMGVNYKIVSQSNPSMVKFGSDTTYIKHTIQDTNEPHKFDAFFDPYHVSQGYGEATVTTYAGGKDPCSLISPAITMSTIIDPEYQNTEITLIPFADTENPDLAGYPKTMEGAFLEVRIEVMNGTDDNWINTTVMPELPSQLGNTEMVMSYVAYPRPLVPDDNIGTFEAGWRFNEPEDEVLIKMGNTLPKMQPSRRAYFIFLFKIDETLEKNIYSLPFSMSGERVHYDGTENGSINYGIPSAKFCITERNANGNIIEYPLFVIGQGNLQNIEVQSTENFHGMENVKWSFEDINHSDFESLNNQLPAVYDSISGIETIDLSLFSPFPTKDTVKFYLLEQGMVYSDVAGEDVNLSTLETLNYTYNSEAGVVKDYKVNVSPVGPNIEVERFVVKINGEIYHPGDTLFPQTEIDIEIKIETQNNGNDISKDTKLTAYVGSFFIPIAHLLPDNCTYEDGIITAHLGSIIPGDKKDMTIHFTIKPFSWLGMKTESGIDLQTVITAIDVHYSGTVLKRSFTYSNEKDLEVNAFDFHFNELSTDKTISYPNQTIPLSIEMENRALPVQSTTLSVFAVYDTDTTLVENILIQDWQRGEAYTKTINYTIPNTKIASKLTFLAHIDSDEKFDEIYEENNVRSFNLPYKVPVVAVNKTAIDINHKTVIDNDTLMFSPYDTLLISTQIMIENTGNDAAENMSLSITPGSNLKPVMDSIEGNATFDNGKLTIHQDDLGAGKSRQITLYFAEIERIRNSVFIELPVIESIQLDYDEKTSGIKRQNEDKEILSVPVRFMEIYDFEMIELRADKSVISQGEQLQISAYTENTALLADDVALRIYALVARDTVEIGILDINDFSIQNPAELSVDYFIPMDSYFTKFFARIDANEEFSEISEENNIKILSVPMTGVDLINNVMNYPNPFTYQTTIYYTLPIDLKEVNIKVFSSNRQEIAHFENCPHQTGHNFVIWNIEQLAAGTYYYHITGKDEKGNTHSVYDKMVKIRLK